MTERITINVGGRRFETLLSTLARRPSSLLGDEQRRAPFWDEARGELFFDRSSSSFEGILLAYQTSSTPQRPPGVSDKTFVDDLGFFGLSEGAEQLTAATSDVSPLPGPRAAIARVVGSPAVVVVSAVITTISVVLYMLESLPVLQEAGGSNRLVLGLELACALAMGVEAVALTVTHRWQGLTSRGVLLIIDLVACVMFVIAASLVFDGGYNNFLLASAIGYPARLLRLCRVFRLIQVSRSGRDLLRAAAAAAPACGAVLAVWLTAAVFFATVMHWSDRDVAYEPNSLPEALYMTVITMTTVGYGDMVPVTPVAKVFGCLCAYTGCSLAALPAVLLVVKFAQLRAAEEPQHAGGKGATDGAVLCTRM